MALLKLAKAYIVGVRDRRRLAEDVISSLRCMQVTNAVEEDHHFLIEGWVPVKWFGELSEVMEAASDGGVFVGWDESVDPALAGAPVGLENPKSRRPFQILVELYSLPGRDDYDPTFATWLFMPLFFGVMIGDVGYGILFIAAGWLLGRYLHTPVADLARVLLIFGGAWSIAFGFALFGEFFGLPIPLPIPGYPIIHRSEDLLALFALALVLGATHMNVGLLLGFRLERRRHGLRAAVLRKLSWIVLENGLFLLIVSLLGLVLPVLWIPAVALITVATALISIGGGLSAAVEVPGFVSNLLSYLRIAVIGVAKSAMAAVVNTLAFGSLFPLGIAGIVGGIVLLVVGHAFVAVMAFLMVTVQALRLHYVEFYNKFYEGALGGARFAPSIRPRSGGEGGVALE